MMARMEISGIDACLAGLEDMIDKTPQLRDDILEAEANVIEPALRQSIAQERLIRSHSLQKSITRRKTTVAGVPGIRIGPSGEHHRYLPSNGKSGIVTAGYVGYVGEYGIPRRGIKGREWLKRALEKSKSQAYAAADAVYYKFMDKQNL